MEKDAVVDDLDQRSFSYLMLAANTYLPLRVFTVVLPYSQTGGRELGWFPKKTGPP